MTRGAAPAETTTTEGAAEAETLTQGAAPAETTTTEGAAAAETLTQGAAPAETLTEGAAHAETLTEEAAPADADTESEGRRGERCWYWSRHYKEWVKARLLERYENSRRCRLDCKRKALWKHVRFTTPTESACSDQERSEPATPPASEPATPRAEPAEPAAVPPCSHNVLSFGRMGTCVQCGKTDARWKCMACGVFLCAGTEDGRPLPCP